MEETLPPKYRIKVSVNDITDERSYMPQIRSGLYTPTQYIYRDLSSYLYNDEGHFVEGIYTLEWALDAIIQQTVKDAWRPSHYLRDDGKVEVI